MADDSGGRVGVASENRPSTRWGQWPPGERQRRAGTHARALVAALASLGFLAVTLRAVGPQPTTAFAASVARAAANASCATLAGADPTATNGRSWGRTILAGGGAKDGWFGVDVCANGFNGAAPNGSNVSCDRV